MLTINRTTLKKEPREIWKSTSRELKIMWEKTKDTLDYLDQVFNWNITVAKLIAGDNGVILLHLHIPRFSFP